MNKFEKNTKENLSPPEKEMQELAFEKCISYIQNHKRFTMKLTNLFSKIQPNIESYSDYFISSFRKEISSKELSDKEDIKLYDELIRAASIHLFLITIIACASSPKNIVDKLYEHVYLVIDKHEKGECENCDKSFH